MTLPRWSSLLTAGILAALITAVWCGFVAPAPFTPYTFQFELSTPVEIRTHLYYSRGAGWRESEATSDLVQRTGYFVPVKLPLLRGKYRGFRFKPIDRAGIVQFRDARIVTFDGRTVRRFSSSDFIPNDAVVRLEERRGVTLVETRADNELGQLSIDFEPVLRLGFGLWSNVSLHGPRVFRIFVLSAVSLLVFEMMWRARNRLRCDIVNFCLRRPRSGLAFCALLAATAASYPVVFLGKSYLAPNNSTVLLYAAAPTLPGYTDVRQDDSQSADVGALMWQHLPYTVRQHKALAAGDLPLWNRYSSAGVTLFGQGQSMFGDPLHFLVIAARGEAWAFDLKFVLVKALFAWGLGLCVWILTRDLAASAVLTFASVFIGFFNYRYNHPAIFTLCYSPWILVAWLNLAFAPDRRAFRLALALWFLANWMVLTSGTVKEAYLLIVSLNFTGVLTIVLCRGAVREKLTRALFIGLAGVAFVLVSSPLWWSFLHSLASAKTTYEIPRVVQIPGAWFAGLFDDLFYREFIPNHSVYQPSANFLFWAGAVLAVMRPRRLLATPGVIAVVISSLAAIAFAFQLGSPTYVAWVLKVPFLGNVHNFNNVFSCVAIVHLGILAGWGFSVARRPLTNGQAGRCTLMVTTPWLLLFVPYFLHQPPAWANKPTWHGWSDLTLYHGIVYMHVFLLPLAAWMLFRTASHRLRRIPVSRTEIGIMIVAVGLILVRHGQHAPFVEPNSFLTTPGTRADLFRSSATIEFLRGVTSDEPGRVIGTNANLFPGFATVHDLEGINGPNALDNRQYREISEAAGIATPGDWRYEMKTAELPKWRPILDFLNVRYIAAAPEELSDPPGYAKVDRFDLEVYRSEHSWPRAFFTDRVEHYDTTGQFVEMIRERASIAPFAAVQTSDSIPSLNLPPRSDGVESASVVAARNYHLETNRTSFTIDAPAAGVVVLQEPWLAEDFQATVNGNPTPYLRINHAFKGLVIPGAGTYRVEFTYWPRGLTLCLLLAAVGLAGCVILWIFIGRRASEAEAFPGKAAVV